VTSYIKSKCIFLGLLVVPWLALAGGDPSPRNTLSLDGVWEIAEGSMDQVPKKFDHQIPVPGLVSLAQPPFPEIGLKSRQRDAFWYRRTFDLHQSIPAIARLKVSKAMFGSRVFVNGKLLGDHAPSFTPGYFDLKEVLRPGKNELLIRVGASRDCVEPTVPTGLDVEKILYIPGIFDSVELILTGSPYIRNVQTAPDIHSQKIRVQAVVFGANEAGKGSLKFTVREKVSGAVVGTATASLESLNAGPDQTVDVSIPVAKCRLWSPEDPFLYDLSVESSADRFDTRFGMREFYFDSAKGHAVLNGRPYYMRGSNVTLYRFFEDSQCGNLPWNEQWVRDLHLSFKKFHWNSLRYCIGFPPEKWYRIADELGFLIQDEFPLWAAGSWVKDAPKQTDSWPTTEELVRQYTDWMQERWNHPCVVLWDAQNESKLDATGAAIRQVRGLDLSNRPWDNGWSAPDAPGDPLESHPYHFYNPRFTLRDMPRQKREPSVWPWMRGPEPRAIIVNEYGYLWLNRDGTPTKLTEKVYQNLLPPDSTTEQRFHTYARTMAAETEFWRAHRKCAAVMHFAALGYSRPGGYTSDHFVDVAKLVYQPDFVKYMPDAFAPVGLMIDYWNDQAETGAVVQITVIAINDLDEPWSGHVNLRVLDEEKILSEKSQPGTIEALGQTHLTFDISFPSRPRKYLIQAELSGAKGDSVRSLRDIEVISSEDFKKAGSGKNPGTPNQEKHMKHSKTGQNDAFTPLCQIQASVLKPAPASSLRMMFSRPSMKTIRF